LADPIDQRRRLEDQQRAKAAGDHEAMPVDEPFLQALEHGMPATSGSGIGFDRLCALLFGQDNLRQVILFPLVKTVNR
jgi:lysyl-tRNA synthetase class 2